MLLLLFWMFMLLFLPSDGYASIVLSSKSKYKSNPGTTFSVWYWEIYQCLFDFFHQKKPYEEDVEFDNIVMMTSYIVIIQLLFCLCQLTSHFDISILIERLFNMVCFNIFKVKLSIINWGWQMIQYVSCTRSIDINKTIFLFHLFFWKFI